MRTVKPVALQVRIRPDLHQALKLRAEHEERTLNGMIARLLEQGLGSLPDALPAPDTPITVEPIEEDVARTDVTATPDGRLSRKNAAAYLGVKPKTLANWGRLGIGPRSILVGGRRFYRLEEIRQFASGEKAVWQALQNNIASALDLPG